MIGQFVTSKAGRDKGSLYVVVAVEGDFVWLCDGKLKRPEAPKKKRRKHVQPISAWVEESLLERLWEGRKVYAEEIRYELKKYYGKQAQLPVVSQQQNITCSDKPYCQTCMRNQE